MTMMHDYIIHFLLTFLTDGLSIRQIWCKIYIVMVVVMIFSCKLIKIEGYCCPDYYVGKVKTSWFVCLFCHLFLCFDSTWEK